MPFNDESSCKQRLNLSPLAHEIISNDMSIFEEERYSTFINKIFKNYHEKANMSIKNTLDHYRNELNELLSKVQSETKTQVIDRLVKDQEYKLKKEADSYEKGEQSSFCINKENLIYLETICEENKYFKRGKYIKCVLEEYARLPFIEREAIYFQSNIETIENAIRAKVQLRIVTEANSVFSVYPYKILPDPLSTRNYLVGYSKRYNSEDTLLPCSFRISTLKSVSPEKSKSAFLKKEKITTLLNTISQRGVQFMIGKESEIKVRLTPVGIAKLHRLIHLRPRSTEQNGNIYTFQCTEAQAEFYFFKFGKDAEIISPISLRERFISLYENALATYQTEDELLPDQENSTVGTLDPS